MSGFRISPLQSRTAGNLKGFGFTIDFSHSSSTQAPRPKADEESRDANPLGVTGIYGGSCR